MAIEYAKGNIIEMFASGEHELLIHGCNCFHTMGRGLAKALRDKWPAVYDEDLKTPYGDREKLGTFRFADIGHGQQVINFYSQWRYDKKDVVINYAALEQGLEALKEHIVAKGMDHHRIIMPLIGATNAGGDPIFIRQIIQGTLGDLNVTVVEGFIQEVRDQVHVIHMPITSNNDLRSGIKLFQQHGNMTQWMRKIGRKAVLILDHQYMRFEQVLDLSRINIFTHFFIVWDKHHIIDYYDTDNIHNEHGAERTLMMARDFCNETGRNSIFILGGQGLLDLTRDYADMIHHVEIRAPTEDENGLADYSAFDELGEESAVWINPSFAKYTTSYGRAESTDPDLFIRDVVYKRKDKPYRD